MLQIAGLLLLMFASTLTQAMDVSVSVPMKVSRVGTHSYFIQGLSGPASSENQGFMSNAGFVVTREGVVIFDTLGTPPLARKMLEQIRKITRLPIKLVIISHYHADHYYGIQVFKEQGAEIWAHRDAQGQTRTENSRLRFEQRKEVLFPWVNETTRLIEADKFLEGDTDFEMGGVHFSIRHVGPAHSAEDLAMMVREDRVLYAGDLVFKGRIPFVGDADSRAWLTSLDKLLDLKPKVLVPGHGAVSKTPAKDLILTRDYLKFLRAEMGKAVDEFLGFEEAYSRTNWSKYKNMPAFEAANRPNAYNTYLLLEREQLK